MESIDVKHSIIKSITLPFFIYSSFSFNCRNSILNIFNGVLPFMKLFFNNIFKCGNKFFANL